MANPSTRRTFSHLLRCGLAVLLATIPVLTGVSARAQEAPAPDGISIRLLEAPVALADDPRAQSYIVDNLPPGSTIDRRFEVGNDTGAEREIRLYAGAADIADGGGFTLLEGRAENELTSWMRVEPASIVIPNGGSAEGVVTIEIPPDATEAERYAVVWAEADGNSSGGGIASVSRVGIRTYLSVGPGNGPPADFTVDSIVPGRTDDGAPQLAVTVANTGGRALDPTGTVTLGAGPGGISAAPVDGSGATIRPGDSGTVDFTLDAALPAGPWTADVSVTSGTVTRTGSATVTFPDTNTGDVVGLASNDSGTPPWVWVLVALAVLAAIGGGLLLLRRRSTSGP